MKRRILAAITTLLALLFCGAALADGNPSLANYDAYYEEYTGAEGLGWAKDGEYIWVVSKNASLWSQPKTNSEKLASVAYEEKMTAQLDESGRPIEQDGFYQVKYKGKRGWVNKAYAAYMPLEIVLMESNVPAYCAPSTSAKRVGSLSKMTRCKVLGFYEDFYVVSLRQAAAYIPMDAAHYDSVFESAYQQRHASAVTTKDVVLRTGPGEGYAKVQELDSGYPITVYGQYDGWYVMMYYDNDIEVFQFAPQDGVRITSQWLEN